MPNHHWRCQLCDATNAKAANSCRNCGLAAHASRAEVVAAQRGECHWNPVTEEPPPTKPAVAEPTAPAPAVLSEHRRFLREFGEWTKPYRIVHKLLAYLGLFITVGGGAWFAAAWGLVMIGASVLTMLVGIGLMLVADQLHKRSKAGHS
jgi:hypothetical protein